MAYILASCAGNSRTHSASAHVILSTFFAVLLVGFLVFDTAQYQPAIGAQMARARAASVEGRRGVAGLTAVPAAVILARCCVRTTSSG